MFYKIVCPYEGKLVSPNVYLNALPEALQSNMGLALQYVLMMWVRPTIPGSKIFIVKDFNAASRWFSIYNLSRSGALLFECEAENPVEAWTTGHHWENAIIPLRDDFENFWKNPYAGRAPVPQMSLYLANAVRLTKEIKPAGLK